MLVSKAETEERPEDTPLTGFDFGMSFGMENIFGEDGEGMKTMEEADYEEYDPAEENLQEEVEDQEDLLDEFTEKLEQEAAFTVPIRRGRKTEATLTMPIREKRMKENGEEEPLLRRQAT
jgi:hypothetical protein